MAAASGNATINVGAFPGVDAYTTTVVAAGCTASSQVQAELQPEATADHSVDEHLVDGPRVLAHTPALGSFQVTLVAPRFEGGAGGKGAAGAVRKIWGTWRIHWAHS